MISNHTAYHHSILASKAKVSFDPSNKKHMLDFAKFVKYNSWRDGCMYYLEDPHTDIPTMIRAKIADAIILTYAEKV